MSTDMDEEQKQKLSEAGEETVKTESVQLPEAPKPATDAGLKLPGEEIASKANAAPRKTENEKAGSSQAEKKVKGFARECCEIVITTLILLIIIRTALAETRYIPSSSMEPTLQINDRLLVEKVSGWTARPIERGEILVFYPPPIELGGKDVSSSPLYVMGRLTGLPFFPIDTAYIKRVIGLPGDQVEVVKGEGVKINGQMLPEPYVQKAANYDLKILADIGGQNAVNETIHPYENSSEPILVPPGKLFMMGDNRNNSADSHVWGFLDQKRVVGKGCLVFWRLLGPGSNSK